MTDKFKPTIPELDKLAKVADYMYLKGHTMKYWMPHENRDQMAQVLEGVNEEQLRDYNDKMYGTHTCSDDSFLISFGQKVHPSISCRVILEVLEKKNA